MGHVQGVGGGADADPLEDGMTVGFSDPMEGEELPRVVGMDPLPGNDGSVPEVGRGEDPWPITGLARRLTLKGFRFGV